MEVRGQERMRPSCLDHMDWDAEDRKRYRIRGQLKRRILVLEKR